MKKKIKRQYSVNQKIQLALIIQLHNLLEAIKEMNSLRIATSWVEMKYLIKKIER
jgi:hypothetical protein